MVPVYRTDAADFDYRIFQGASCAFGVFDGVHRGHRFLLGCAQQTAADVPAAGRSIALTFDSDPDEAFHPDRLKKLLTNADRLEMLATTGVDAVVVLPFTRDFAALSPMEFLQKTFGGHAPAYLHVGFDFHFGAKAAGSVAELKAWAQPFGTQICAHDLKSDDGAPITATRIRLLLDAGDIQEANKLLGRPYYLRGVVEAGRGQGRDMGFHTANLSPAFAFRVLGEGVYAGFATVAGARYKAAVSVGVSPVFAGEATASCEVHILDFSGDLYGQEIKVEFIEFLRPMIKFESTEALVATVMSNIAYVRENLTL
ncbi:MAG: riboflavin biosynthesis protein RibF [Raoultibacter sp.]